MTAKVTPAEAQLRRQKELQRELARKLQVMGAGEFHKLLEVGQRKGTTESRADGKTEQTTIDTR